MLNKLLYWWGGKKPTQEQLEDYIKELIAKAESFEWAIVKCKQEYDRVLAESRCTLSALCLKYGEKLVIEKELLETVQNNNLTLKIEATSDDKGWVFYIVEQKDENAK